MPLPVVLDRATFDKLAEAYHQTRRELRNLKHTLATLERSGRGQGLPIFEQAVQAWTTSGSPTAGDVLEANADNLITGRVRRWRHDTMREDEDCWLKLVDFYDTDSGDVFALHGRFYLARREGSMVSGGTLKPLYLATVGNQEIYCKPNATIAKGSTGTVSLFNDDFTDSTIDKSSVLAKFHAATFTTDLATTKWHSLTRAMGTWIVHPVEC